MSVPHATHSQVVVLSGGVGGAKLVLGLAGEIDPERLVVLGNTGDDETIHGLHISPDLDTLLYTLSGLADPAKGWGVTGDTFGCMEAMERLGGEHWFRLGDRDLAVHLLRTCMLREGQRLTEVTHLLRRRLGVKARVLPATDDPIRTRVQTAAGWLNFQDFFVRERCAPDVEDVDFSGAAEARLTLDARDVIREASLIVFAPSNPVASVGPILAIPGMKNAIAASKARKVAVSPFVGGRSLKGPSDRMMRALGYEPTTEGVLRYYGNLVECILVDESDETPAPEGGAKVVRAPIVMNTLEEKRALARAVLAA